MKPTLTIELSPGEIEVLLKGLYLHRDVTHDAAYFEEPYKSVIKKLLAWCYATKEPYIAEKYEGHLRWNRFSPILLKLGNLINKRREDFAVLDIAERVASDEMRKEGYEVPYTEDEIEDPELNPEQGDIMIEMYRRSDILMKKMNSGELKVSLEPVKNNYRR